MNKLKLLWLSPKTPIKTKGLATWAEEMERIGFELTDNVDDADLVFFGSDSQLKQELIGKKPTILYFWGWMPARLLDRNFQGFAQEQLKMMAQCTRILVPGMVTMDQVADFGLPSQLCLPGVDSRALDWGYGLPVNKKPQVMFLSRLAPHKHLDILIQAMSLIEPSPQLLVVGPGDVEPYRKLASSLGVPTTFIELEDKEKVEALRDSAVLVHPSSYEGFGLPPLEALYCMTPVIVFDIPQMRWLLQEDAYYFSTVEGLAQTIVHIFQNPSEAQVKAVHGADRIRKSLTWEHASERLWGHIHQTHKEFWAQVVRQDPSRYVEAYDQEHKRNWTYSVDRFDPTWARHWRAQTFIDLLKECNTENILDVGCGTVYPTIFARAGFDVTALDISEECLNQVMNIAEKWNMDGKVTTVRGDAQSLEFPDDNFDAVVQGELWEHVLDVEKVIYEGLRVLKPGGYLIATSPIGTHHYDPFHMRVFDDESIRALVNKFSDRANCRKLEKIAEQGTDPSCYLIVLEKL